MQVLLIRNIKQRAYQMATQPGCQLNQQVLYLGDKTRDHPLGQICGLMGWVVAAHPQHKELLALHVFLHDAFRAVMQACGLELPFCPFTEDDTQALEWLSHEA